MQASLPSHRTAMPLTFAAILCGTQSNTVNQPGGEKKNMKLNNISKRHHGNVTFLCHFSLSLIYASPVRSGLDELQRARFSHSASLYNFNSQCNITGLLNEWLAILSCNVDKALGFG